MGKKTVALTILPLVFPTGCFAADVVHSPDWTRPHSLPTCLGATSFCCLPATTAALKPALLPRKLPSVQSQGSTLSAAKALPCPAWWAALAFILFPPGERPSPSMCPPRGVDAHAFAKTQGTHSPALTHPPFNVAACMHGLRSRRPTLPHPTPGFSVRAWLRAQPTAPLCGSPHVRTACMHACMEHFGTFGAH